VTDVYQAPEAELTLDQENTSGLGKGHAIPDGVSGWSWGAFLLNWIWAIGNKSWIGLIALLPYVGFIMTIMLGIKGREWAWRNKRWESVEHFQRVQKKWSMWGLIIFLGALVLGIGAAILIPMLAR